MKAYPSSSKLLDSACSTHGMGSIRPRTSPAVHVAKSTSLQCVFNGPIDWLNRVTPYLHVRLGRGRLTDIFRSGPQSNLFRHGT